MTGAGQVRRYYNVGGGHLRADPEGTLMAFADYEALLREVEGLKAALREYGEHKAACVNHPSIADGPWGSRLVCSCGFDAALSPASGGV